MNGDLFLQMLLVRHSKEANSPVSIRLQFQYLKRQNSTDRFQFVLTVLFHSVSFRSCYGQMKKNE